MRRWHDDKDEAGKRHDYGEHDRLVRLSVGVHGEESMVRVRRRLDNASRGENETCLGSDRLMHNITSDRTRSSS